MSLSILIREDGLITVSSGGVVIEYIKSICIDMDEDLRPVPHISIVMADVRHLPDDTIRTMARRSLQHYKKLLDAHPLVHVADGNEHAVHPVECKCKKQ